MINAQALLQGMQHPKNAQGWGLQAISTFKDKGTGSAINPAISGVSASYVNFNYTKFVLDINSTTIDFANSSPYGKYGISISSLNYGQWDEKDEQGNKIGTFGVNDLYTRVNWANQIKGNLYSGINLSYGFSRLYDYTANYLTGGMGIIYQTKSDITLGLSAVNFVLSGKSYVKKEKLESILVLGASKKLAYLPMRIGIDAIRTSSQNFYFNLGGLLSLERLFITWGISSKKQDLSTEDPVNNLIAGISGGFGINFEPYSLSFGYRNMGGMGAIFSFSINWAFTKGDDD
ncbi:MAG: hypothetical protein K9M80_00595 [Candidatus Marinimicrobia bacterium]|nr:hypothetical protein [Candidatus Neomarinimicrobiota bacterium]